MKEELFYNGIFHSMKGEGDVFSFMTVKAGMITGTYKDRPAGRFSRETDLGGRHVYPCLIDGHVHMLYTIAVMAMGFNLCNITPDGITPSTIGGVADKIRSHCAGKPENAVIAANNYIMSAVDEKRMPTRFELDVWAGGRSIAVYNIDGHSTSLSTSMMRRIGLEPEGHDGVLTGEENERNQGRLTDVIAGSIGISTLAKGIANFHNTCARYGICMVGALEGNGDSEKDLSTALIFHLARRFDLQVRMYLQYMDLDRARKFEKYMTHKRLGGCGDWEMDGSVGSHTAAFFGPYKETGETAPCYYEQAFVNQKVAEADAAGYQVASHAIGEAGIERIMTAMKGCRSSTLHRIEHMEFINEEQLERLDGGRYAVMMQPGYAWIDKRYLHTYSSYLPESIESNLKLRSIADRGVLLCGSSDSPVQAMDPWLQMLGMCDFYNPAESLTSYQAMEAYTVNAAKAVLEDNSFGTLETGKRADFFTNERDFFSLPVNEISGFRPEQTFYGGSPYREKSGSIAEFIAMLLKNPRKV